MRAASCEQARGNNDAKASSFDRNFFLTRASLALSTKASIESAMRRDYRYREDENSCRLSSNEREIVCGDNIRGRIIFGIVKGGINGAD